MKYAQGMASFLIKAIKISTSIIFKLVGISLHIGYYQSLTSCSTRPDIALCILLLLGIIYKLAGLVVHFRCCQTLQDKFPRLFPRIHKLFNCSYLLLLGTTIVLLATTLSKSSIWCGPTWILVMDTAWLCLLIVDFIVSYFGSEEPSHSQPQISIPPAHAELQAEVESLRNQNHQQMNELRSRETELTVLRILAIPSMLHSQNK